jgi:Zn-dependent peptidase ImmA (M78 family)
MIERQRFTIYHELAHTYFPGAFEFVRHQESFPADQAHRKFENLCDIGAAELLLPYDEFLADIKTR